MSQQYTNELTTDVLERLRQPPFTDEFLSELEPQSRQSLVAEMESMLQRPILHIFRGATIGSLTRHGGVIRETSGKSTLDGHYSARVGDKVVYPDGREATIICGAGKGRVMQGNRWRSWAACWITVMKSFRHLRGVRCLYSVRAMHCRMAFNCAGR